jgi:1-pyrroline-5-carboxylate dehydrogenase
MSFFVGEEIKTGDVEKILCPHDHKTVLGVFHKAKPQHLQKSVEAAMEARKKWSVSDFDTRFIYPCNFLIV